MDIKPIHNEEDYEAALIEIERIFDAKQGTSNGDKLEVLSILVDNYETNYYPIPLPDPIEAIKFHMERLHVSRKDLTTYIGGASRISEILNRKRRLTIRMIRNLHKGMGIPVDVLIQHYELEGPEA